MTKGIGIDIVEVANIKNMANKWGDKALKKVFTEKELTYCNSIKNKFLSLSARFAAKEAVMKAIGVNLDNGWLWKDIEIIRLETGKPKVNLSGKIRTLFEKLKLTKIEVSLSHSDNFAVASAIVE